MIEMAFFGQAFADAELKQGRRGEYAAILASTDNSGDEDDESQPFLVVRLVVSGELVDEALAIKRGDRLYVEGAASIGVWNARGTWKPNVSVKVHHIRKSRIGEHREAQKLEPEAEFIAAALIQPQPEAELMTLPMFLLNKPKVARERNHAL